MTYKPQERDVILVPLGVYEALRLIQQEKQNFQAGIKTYLEKKQDLATCSKSKFATSKKEAQDALTTSPDSTRIRLKLATHLEMQGDIDGAINHLQEVITINQDNHPDVYVRLALLYERQEDFTEALNSYKERQERLEERLNNVVKLRPALLLRRAPKGYRNLPRAYLINVLVTSVCKQEVQNLKNFQHNVPTEQLNAENPPTN